VQATVDPYLPYTRFRSRPSACSRTSGSLSARSSRRRSYVRAAMTRVLVTQVPGASAWNRGSVGVR